MIRQTTKVLSKPSLTLGCLTKNPQVQKCMISQTKGTDKRCEEKPKKSRKLVTAATIAVLGTTVAVIAAKHDDDFREWTKENLPTLDSTVKVIYQEEETYLEFLARAHKELTEWIKNGLYDAFKGIKQSKSLKKGGGSVPEVCEESKKPYKPPESAFMVKKDGHEKKDIDADISAKKGLTVVLPVHIKELKDLEDKMGHAAQDTIQSFHAAVCAMKEQASLIDNLQQLVSKHDCKVWEKLQKRMNEEQKQLDKAESGLKTLEKTSENLKSRLEKDPELTEDMKRQARNNLIIVMGDVQRAKENWEKEKGKMTLSRRSWDKVRQARMHFTEELETLFPNVWLNDENLNLPLDSLDPFILNVLSNILFLEKELAKFQTVRDSEVSSAIERFNITQDSKGLVTAAVNMEGSKQKRLLQEEMQKSLLTHKAKCEKNARSLMKQQAEVYSDLKLEAVSMKEREVERRMHQQLEERLADVRAQHKMEIAKMVGRIQGANEAISQRGDKDKDQQEKQRFWSAAQSLVSAVKQVGVPQQKELKPLKNEVTNLAKAAPEGDSFVGNVLSSIPPQALERGVESDSKLRERFLTVEKEARKVAAVPCGEVSLFQMLLARVQKTLYIDEAIPPQELDNEPVDIEGLNNYELLYRARHYVERGEYDQAVRYLNLLKGPSRQVASDWMKDVIVHLETRQAADVLLAYASACSLEA